MFSNTAYEAMYQYLGLSLHAKFIEVITSQKVFGAIILMTFGVMFFLTTLQFFSRYMPGALVAKKSVPLSRYVKIVACLFLGTALLKVGGTTSVKRFTGESWHDNPYIKGQVSNPSPEYQVSFVFLVMSKTAEEIAGLLNRVVDGLFMNVHSQVEYPDFFFKAMAYAGAGSIEDPKLRQGIKFYTEECVDRLLPLIRETKADGRLDGFFASGSIYDQKLAQLSIETKDETPYNCLDVKEEVREGLKIYAMNRPHKLGQKIDEAVRPGKLNSNKFTNYEISSYLSELYLDQHESLNGIQRGSQLPGTGGRIFQYLNRFFSFDTFLPNSMQGSVVAAKRSQEFSEELARAPHVAGFIKMFAIALFPFLIFFVVAGRWKVLVYWWVIYFSVLLWAPMWTLLYHVMTGITYSGEVMKAFGELNDGVSLYGAQLVTSRIYHLYEVYSWLQILLGTLFTGMVLWFLKPALSDTESESAPDFIDTASGMAQSGARTVGKVL